MIIQGQILHIQGKKEIEQRKDLVLIDNMTQAGKELDLLANNESLIFLTRSFYFWQMLLPKKLLPKKLRSSLLLLFPSGVYNNYRLLIKQYLKFEMRVLKKQKSYSQNKQNQEDDILYSFSKNIKSHLQKPARKTSNFVQRVNGYIEAILPPQKTYKATSRHNNSIPVTTKTKKFSKEVEKTKRSFGDVEQKIKKQKQMNKNLQKCIIQIQKILWQRNERLEQLEDQLRFHSKKESVETYLEEQSASKYSCNRIKEAHKQLKKQIQTLGVHQIISNMTSDQNEQQSSVLNTQSSIEYERECSYIKKRRPRTQSQSQALSSKRIK